MMAYFMVFHSVLSTLARLTDEQFGRVMRALLRYSAKKEEPANLTDIELIAFEMYRDQIDRDEQKYETKCARLRENGAKGGRPRKTNCDQVVQGESICEQDNCKGKGKDEDKEKREEEDKDKGGNGNAATFGLRVGSEWHPHIDAGREA